MKGPCAKKRSDKKGDRHRHHNLENQIKSKKYPCTRGHATPDKQNTNEIGFAARGPHHRLLHRRHGPWAVLFRFLHLMRIRSLTNLWPMELFAPLDHLEGIRDAAPPSCNADLVWLQRVVYQQKKHGI